MKFDVCFKNDVFRHLAVFARAPRPGLVKTRLAPLLKNRCAAFYAAMLRDVLQNAEIAAQNSGAQMSVFYMPDEAFDAGGYSLNHFWNGAKYPQSAGDIGVRMLHCFHALQKQSSTHIVLIGSDSPDLPPEYLIQAFKLLEKNDLVFGPAQDGGFYLLGASRTLPDEIFQDVRWSCSQTLEQVLQNAQLLKWSVSLLPQWHDVDTPDDLHGLSTRLKSHPQNALHSARWLRENFD